MASFSKRVQVMLSPEQFSRLQAIARSEGESVGSLVRQAIEDVYVRREEHERLDAVQRLGAMHLPVSDWEQMEREADLRHWSPLGSPGRQRRHPPD